MKPHHKLGVVSDAQSAYGLPELRAVGLADHFASTVISGDYGYRKPDAHLIETALAELQVCALGDHPKPAIRDHLKTGQ